MNIYVGYLSPDVTEDDLKEAFQVFGQLASINVVRDKDNGVSRGFGFVEMPSRDESQAAIDTLNGTTLKGQNLIVNEARSRSETRRSGGRQF